MSWGGTTVISFVGLQKGMDLFQGEPGSSNESFVTSTYEGNGVIGTEDDRVSDLSDVDKETKTLPLTKKDPNVSCELVVSVAHVSYRLY